jgi:hypothetical protein
MIVGEKVKTSLSSSFPSWAFLALDAQGKSRGIIIGWRTSALKLIKSRASPSALFTHFFSSKINLNFLFINVYGPCYDIKELWQSFFNMDLHQHTIIGGDLNFTLGA